MAWPFQGWEPLVILVIVLLIFGPTKLPQLARGLGQALYEFRKASQGVLSEEGKQGVRKAQSGGEISEEELKRIAEKLGIKDADKKKKKELIREVVEKAKEKGLVE